MPSGLSLLVDAFRIHQEGDFQSSIETCSQAVRQIITHEDVTQTLLVEFSELLVRATSAHIRKLTTYRAITTSWVFRMKLFATRGPSSNA